MTLPPGASLVTIFNTRFRESRGSGMHQNIGVSTGCSRSWTEDGVRLPQKMQVGPCIPVGTQL